ncbi:MAG: SMP-30/Gluconolaconase/LRE domain protein [Fibrobacteres bacterium]|nr:SMP-30/Gluconolaconase/LRE domain protein [Fibrobacterota bacterium]
MRLPSYPFSARLLAILLTLAAAKAHSQDPGTAVLPDSIMDPGTKVNWVKKMVAYCEGPCMAPNGYLYFTEQKSRSTQEWPIWKINPGNPTDTGVVFVRNSSQANGMNFDAQGRLVAAQNGKVTRYDSTGAPTVLATSGQGASFGLANDLSIHSNGSFYFTDLNTSIFHVDVAGKLTVAYANAQGANGVELVEEKGSVYINEGFSNEVRRYPINPDGSLGAPQHFCDQTGPDGLTLDAHGNFYVASYTLGAINVFNAAGQKLGMITMTAKGNYDTFAGTEANTSNCAFGGPENKTLYISGDGGIYSIRLKIPGRRQPGYPTVANRKTGLAFTLARPIRIAGISGAGFLSPVASRMAGDEKVWGAGGASPTGGLSLSAIDAADRTLAVWSGTLDPVTSVLTASGSGKVPAGFTAWTLSRGTRILAVGR